MRSSFQIARGLVCLVAFAVLGCGGSKGPDLVPAKGVLTLDGKPLAGATVIFHSDGKRGQEGVGQTDDKGAFVLRTTNRDGAIPGSYKVTVQSYVKPDGSPLVVTEQDRQQGIDVTQLIVMGQAKSAVPEKYTDPDSTDVHFEIKAGAKEPISVALISK